ncbi:aldehyde dehydrogenase family protein [Reinekea blandensis]|uniref:Aldehyde dehydrogenase, putative n=1 Tax=Reinekea blandensis MED297 TaxID=314283 RepID=A4B9T9_9GAMM|nr:aldehyde dehydrogenase family protein [Reinekea blandensis]EAR11390.1 aldehyde dehydrogenase, putative [Reinekea sp. MED297] [Reinekea blandensis MED297]
MNGLPESVQSAAQTMAGLGEEHILEAGDYLTLQSSPGQMSMALVLSGQLTVFTVDDELQTEQPLRFIGAGQLAEAGLPLFIRAQSSTRLCLIEFSVHQHLVSGRHPDSAGYIALLQHSLFSHIGAVEPNRHDVRSPVVDAMVARSVVAQNSIQTLPEDQIDAMIGDIADAVNRESWNLAEAAILETGMGVVNHRVQKILLGTMEVAASLMGQTGSGALQIESPMVDAMSVPMGVILGLIPVTNPVETLVFKTLISLKSRNAIILSSHRKARQVSDRTVSIIRSVLSRYQVNPDLVQIPSQAPRRELTSLLMSHPDIAFILATGGPGMVRSAYQSGTPSIGVGKGNAPVWVCDDADVKTAAKQIVDSKSFDNGIVCGSENNLIADRSVYDDLRRALEAQGAAVLEAKEVVRLNNAVLEGGKLCGDWMGKGASLICQQAGIERPYPIRLIAVPQSVFDQNSPWLREKLAPIVSLMGVESEAEALSVARRVLALEGRGHTAIVHTQDAERIERYAKACDVCRVLVNSPGTQGCIGACNGLELSWTLGCGTAGGSSTSDNVTYRHLQNTKRIARALPEIDLAQKLA